MNTLKRTSIALAVLLAFTGTAFAEGHLAGRTQPKALNPQPEVPSKPKAHDSVELKGRTDPKALNPQPEVPSKPKAQKHKPPKTARQ